MRAAAAAGLSGYVIRRNRRRPAHTASPGSLAATGGPNRRGRCGQGPHSAPLVGKSPAAAAFGDLVAYEYGRGLELDEDIAWIFKTKGGHAALQQMSARRQIPTDADDKYYAFLRTASDGSERVLVVLNFQANPETVEVRLDGVRASQLVDLRDGSSTPRAARVRVELPAYGYRFFRVEAR
jgi:Maltogenic Amylase, C-terminal domain